MVVDPITTGAVMGGLKIAVDLTKGITESVKNLKKGKVRDELMVATSDLTQALLESRTQALDLAERLHEKEDFIRALEEKNKEKEI